MVFMLPKKTSHVSPTKRIYHKKYQKMLCEEFFCTTFPNSEPFIAFYPVPFQPPNSFGGPGWFIVDFRISQILAETPGRKKLSMNQSIEILESDFNSFSTILRSLFKLQLPPWKLTWKAKVKVWKTISSSNRWFAGSNAHFPGCIYFHYASLGLVDRDHTQGRTLSDGTYKETWKGLTASQNVKLFKWHPWHSSHKAKKLTVTICSKREWPWHPFPLYHPCLPRDEVTMERMLSIHLWATCLRSNLYL